MAYLYTDVPVALSLSLAGAPSRCVASDLPARGFLEPGLCHLTTELDDILHGVGVGLRVGLGTRAKCSAVASPLKRCRPLTSP